MPDNKVKIYGRSISSKEIFFYVSVFFFSVYGLLAIVHVSTNRLLFTEYGLFVNDDAALYIFIILLYSVMYLFLINWMTSSRRMKDFRISISSLVYNGIFLFYFLVFFISVADFIVRYDLKSILTTSMIGSISTIGYKVAHSTSKLSFGVISTLPFVFYYYLTSKSKVIKLLSYFSLLFIIFLLFCSGRKEQLLSALIICIFHFRNKMKISKKIIIPILLAIGIIVVYTVNSARADLSGKSIFYILFQSQESYPLVFGAYLAVQKYIDIPIEILFSSLTPLSVMFHTPTAPGYILNKVFGEYGFGPVYSIIGMTVIYFPISILAIFLSNKFLSIFVNTLLSFGEQYHGVIMYIMIKYFIFLRNGNLNYLIQDLLFLLFFCIFILLTKKRQSRI